MAKDQIVVNKIHEATGFLEKHFKINQVILFGSFLSGGFGEHSDIDLAVISPDFEGKNYEDILNVFAQLAIKCDSRLEIHPFSDKDLISAKPTNFMGYLLKNGKTIFKDSKFIAL